MIRATVGRRSTIRAFVRAQSGASALEFAIVAIPFLFLLIATLELSLIFVANTSLQNAAFAAARQLRVGQLIAPGQAATTSSGTTIDLADFKTKICQSMQIVSTSTCVANLYVDVRELPNFNGTMAASPYSGTTLNTSGFCFYSGSSGSVVELRAFYMWPVFTPIMLNMLVNTTQVTGSGGQSGKFFALSAFEVFRNEPGGATNTGASC